MLLNNNGRKFSKRGEFVAIALSAHHVFPHIFS